MAPRAVQDAIGNDRGGDLRRASLVRTDRLSVLVDMDREPLIEVVRHEPDLHVVLVAISEMAPIAGAAAPALGYTTEDPDAGVCRAARNALAAIEAKPAHANSGDAVSPQ